MALKMVSGGAFLCQCDKCKEIGDSKKVQIVLLFESDEDAANFYNGIKDGMRLDTGFEMMESNSTKH